MGGPAHAPPNPTVPFRPAGAGQAPLAGPGAQRTDALLFPRPVLVAFIKRSRPPAPPQKNTPHTPPFPPARLGGLVRYGTARHGSALLGPARPAPPSAARRHCNPATAATSWPVSAQNGNGGGSPEPGTMDGGVGGEAGPRTTTPPRFPPLAARAFVAGEGKKTLKNLAKKIIIKKKSRCVSCLLHKNNKEKKKKTPKKVRAN